MNLDDCAKHEKGLFGGKGGWSYKVDLWLIGPQGTVVPVTVSKMFNEKNQPDVKPYNPFYRATGFLGSAGWELVNVQHASGVGNHPAATAYLSFYQIVAYFKRPVISGRSVDEPKIDFN